jgi:cathepsin B
LFVLAGSCWAVSSAGAFGDRLCITHGLNTTLVSAQDMTSCCNANNGCSGSSGCDGG